MHSKQFALGFISFQTPIWSKVSLPLRCFALLSMEPNGINALVSSKRRRQRLALRLSPPSSPVLALLVFSLLLLTLGLTFHPSASVLRIAGAQPCRSPRILPSPFPVMGCLRLTSPTLHPSVVRDHSLLPFVFRPTTEKPLGSPYFLSGECSSDLFSITSPPNFGFLLPGSGMVVWKWLTE